MAQAIAARLDGEVERIEQQWRDWSEANGGNLELWPNGPDDKP
jgi:hypothetical protein